MDSIKGKVLTEDADMFDDICDKTVDWLDKLFVRRAGDTYNAFCSEASVFVYEVERISNPFAEEF